MICLADFYDGKRIFLTGHTGFKGSWMSLLLEQLGGEVHGFALPPVNRRGSMFEQLAIGSRIASSTYGDIRDSAALDAALSAARPDIIIHMAAQPLVRASYRDPLETWQTIFSAPSTCSRRCAARAPAAPCSTLPPINVTRTASGSGPTARKTGWAVTTRIQRPKPALS
jgi:dTDP-4-dehydrorhamnose reductase